MATQKTIFIVITKGFITRNIIRSGVLEELKKSGARIVILFLNTRKKELPQYLVDEFADGQVIVEVVPPQVTSKAHRAFLFFSGLLVYNRVNRKIRYAIYSRSMFLLFLENLLFASLEKIGFLKKLARFIERTFFSSNFYGSYFDKYTPDVVFSTSVISKLDIDVMKEAHARGIRTVSMPKVWDNITTRFYRYAPDKLIVQNGEMKREAARVQSISSNRIVVTGFPQFDWYRRPEIIQDRETFLKSLGLDPKRKLIVWGSTGRWTPDDGNISDMLVKSLGDDTLISNCSLLIRSHYSDAQHRRFDKYKGTPNVYIDESFSNSEFFRDNTDPRREEIIHFINTMYHADVVVTLCSTLTLDAFCFDKPVINTAFKDLFNNKGEDISTVLYEHDHYQPILELDSIDLVFSEKELFESLNIYLKDSTMKEGNRKKVLDRLCYKVDGNSSKRVAEAILSLT